MFCTFLFSRQQSVLELLSAEKERLEEVVSQEPNRKSIEQQREELSKAREREAALTAQLDRLKKVRWNLNLVLSLPAG